MNDLFQCGAARADITPDEESVCGLFGLMRIPYAGIIDRLSVRVIALADGDEKALIVAFDLDKAPEPAQWLPELSRHTGIPQERILYFGTHTHSAPLTTIRPREKNGADAQQRQNMDRYEAQLLQKLLACADDALARMVPARLGCATGESYVNVNRNADFVYTDADGKKFPFICECMNWKAPVDRTLFAMRMEDLNGEPLAFFVNYPMHCCLMFQNNFDGKGSMGISGDIAGRISTLVEQAYPGAVAVWSSGAAGDVDPALFNAVMYPDPADGHYVKEAIPDWHTTEMLLRMVVGWHYKDVMETLQRIQCQKTSVPIKAGVAWSETPSNTEEPYRIRMQLLQLDDISLVGIGGELYNSLGRLLKENSLTAQTVVINHNASILDDAGYILDDDTLFRAAQDAPTPHFIPGGKSRAKAGFVGPSLVRHLRDLQAQKEG